MNPLNNAQDKRVAELEVKFSFQQETIDSLNEIVTQQWQQIDLLKRHIERLEGRMQEVADASSDTPLPEPPPPHY